MKENIVLPSITLFFFMPLIFLLSNICFGTFENIEALNYFTSSQFVNKILNSLWLCLSISVSSVLIGLGVSFSFFNL